MKREIAVDEFDRELEDAEQNLADSYLNIKVEQISTNADAKAFSEGYWKRIDNAQRTIDSLKERNEEASEAYTEKVQDTKDQIAKYQARIDKLTA